MPEPTTSARRRGRLVAVRLIAVGYALLAALASFGLPSLLLAWTTSGDELPLRTAYVWWGILAGLLIPGLALAAMRRHAAAPLQALAGVVVACLAVLVVGFNTLHLEYLATMALPALVLLVLHPDTPAALRRRVDVAAAPAAIVALMSVPCLWYAVEAALTSRTTRVLDTPSGAYTLHGQYAQAAVLAIALLLCAAVGTRRQPGRTAVVALVCAGTALLGLAGVVFSDDLLSPGRTWGVLVIAATVGYAVTTLGRRPVRATDESAEAPSGATPLRDVRG